MIKNMGSYYFPGFYESIFNGSDDFIDDEVEVKDELGLDDISVDYEYVDFKKYEIDVARKYMECYVEKVIEVLPADITDNKKFEFETVDESMWISSPRYYNYETDKCYWEIKTNIETLGMIKDYTLKMKGVKEYLLNNFTSCDGFVSFISNDLEYWKKLPIEEYQDNMLISLVDMMLKLSDDEVFEDIKFDVVDCVSKYEYVDCYVDYSGKRYELNDFKKLFQ